MGVFEKIFAAALGTGLMLSPVAYATPYTLSLEGQMLTDQGLPLAGPLDIEVTFYRTETGGSPIAVAAQTFNGTVLTDGVFRLNLSGMTEAELATVFTNSDEVWVQIRDLTNNVTLPRMKHNAVPYALKIPVDNDTLVFQPGDGKLKVDAAKVLPPSAGNASKFLMTDGSGGLSWQSPAGAGDMTQAVYDSNSNSAVDAADDSAKLSGQTQSFYTNAGNMASGTLSDARLSGNVSLLGSSIDSAEITNGSIELVDIGANGCASGEILKFNGSAWACAADGAGTGDMLQSVYDVNTDAIIDLDKGGTGATTAAGARTNLGLGTAATLNVGTGNNNIVQLDSSGKLPGVDGSALTNINGSSIASGSISNLRINWSAPGNIGSGTPGTGTFTAVTTNNLGLSLQDNDGTANFTVLKSASAMAANQTYTLPAAPDNGKYLMTDASGNLSWGSPAGAGDMARSTYDSDLNGVVDTSANATNLNGQAASFYTNAGNISSGTLSDARLSGNVSLLGSSIESAEITNGTIELGDIGANGCSSGEILKYNGTAWACAADSVGSGDMLRSTYDINTDAIIDLDKGGTGSSTAAGARANLGLGSAATLNVGTGNNNVVQLDSSGNLPAVDASALTNINGSSIASGSISNLRINWASPGNIGSGTPGTGTFTAVTTNNLGLNLQDNDGTANFTIIKSASAMSANQTYTFPAAPDNGKYLMTDASGNLSWGSPAGAGDMARSTYDSDLNGVVDSSANATNLNGQAASFYTNAGNINAGTLGDGRLSANVSLLGSAIDSSEITNGTILFGDLAGNGCATGEVIKYNGSAWACGTDNAPGSVTSVDVSGPAAGITTSGGPVTTSGTIALSLANDLAAVEGLSGTGGVERTGTDAWSTYTLTAAGKAILDDADASAQRTTLGAAASGANADITSLNALSGNLSTPSSDLTLSNGANHDVAPGTVSYARITGPSAAFSISGFTGGTSGRRLIVQNATAFVMSLSHQTGSAAANQLTLTSGAGTSVTVPANGIAEFIYDATTTKWLKTSVSLDYEEGTFTPTYSGTTTGGSCTYSLQSGTWVRVGKQVTFSIALTWSACGTAPVGAPRVGSLPYVSKNIASLNQQVTILSTSYSPGVSSILVGQISPNSSLISIKRLTVATTPVVADAAIDTAATLNISGAYLID